MLLSIAKTETLKLELKMKAFDSQCQATKAKFEVSFSNNEGSIVLLYCLATGKSAFICKSNSNMLLRAQYSTHEEEGCKSFRTTILLFLLSKLCVIVVHNIKKQSPISSTIIGH